MVNIGQVVLSVLSEIIRRIELSPEKMSTNLRLLRVSEMLVGSEKSVLSRKLLRSCILLSVSDSCSLRKLNKHQSSDSSQSSVCGSHLRRTFSLEFSMSGVEFLSVRIVLTRLARLDRLEPGSC